MLRPQKKKHHYVSATYLRGFCSNDGFLFSYMKDRPNSPIRARPERVAFRNYYYSQTLENGVRENNALEDAFSEIEGEWPRLVDRWSQRDPANDKLDTIMAFLAMHRVRVPAARDVVELSLAENIRATALHLDSLGHLPPRPSELEDSHVLETMEILIDPQKSLEAMANLVKGFSKVIGCVGFEIVHNKTSVNFITSDNPVCVFDPAIPESILEPYVLRSLEAPVEILFPISASLLLRGHSDLKRRFGHFGISNRDEMRASQVWRVNRMIARFAYQNVFALDTSQSALIAKHATRSPTIRTEFIPTSNGIAVVHRSVFGKRPQKPKWY